MREQSVNFLAKTSAWGQYLSYYKEYEPTNHLENSIIHQLMNNPKRLEHALATILISHHLGLVCEVESVYFLQSGRMVAAEGPADLFRAGEEWRLLLDQEKERSR